MLDTRGIHVCSLVNTSIFSTDALDESLAPAFTAAVPPTPNRIPPAKRCYRQLAWKGNWGREATAWDANYGLSSSAFQAGDPLGISELVRNRGFWVREFTHLRRRGYLIKNQSTTFGSIQGNLDRSWDPSSELTSVLLGRCARFVVYSQTYN
jgi:hypothetical protein